MTIGARSAGESCIAALAYCGIHASVWHVRAFAFAPSASHISKIGQISNFFVAYLRPPPAGIARTRFLLREVVDAASSSPANVGDSGPDRAVLSSEFSRSLVRSVSGGVKAGKQEGSA